MPSCSSPSRSLLHLHSIIFSTVPSLLPTSVSFKYPNNGPTARSLASSSANHFFHGRLCHQIPIFLNSFLKIRRCVVHIRHFMYKCMTDRFLSPHHQHSADSTAPIRSAGVGRSLWVGCCGSVAVGWALWVGRCRSVGVGRCWLGAVARLLSVGRCELGAVGRSLWVSRSGLVALGWLLWVGRLQCVGRCGSVAVGRSLWAWSLWVGRLLWVDCCRSIAVGLVTVGMSVAVGWLLWVGRSLWVGRLL